MHGFGFSVTFVVALLFSLPHTWSPMMEHWHWNLISQCIHLSFCHQLPCAFSCTVPTPAHTIARAHIVSPISMCVQLCSARTPDNSTTSCRSKFLGFFLFFSMFSDCHCSCIAFSLHSPRTESTHTEEKKGFAAGCGRSEFIYAFCVQCLLMGGNMTCRNSDGGGDGGKTAAIEHT